MDDSDDSGPLSQQAKRRRTSSRSVRASVHEVIPVDSEDDTPREFDHEISSKEELDVVIAELKRRVKQEKRESQQRGLAAELEIDRLRSALAEQRQEFRHLEDKLDRKREEIQDTKSKLSNWEEGYESSKASTSERKKRLSDALAAIEDLENLAKELPERLQGTAFVSKDTSILSMLLSFYREICQKHFGGDGTILLGVADNNPPPLRELDKIVKRKLFTVLRGLKDHPSHHIFAQPVTEDDAPDYFEVIERPMDLSKIQRKLDSDEYQSLSDLCSDVKLMFDNCREYNGDASSYGEAADRFERQMRHVMEERGLGAW
jgi:Bromodomain